MFIPSLTWSHLVYCVHCSISAKGKSTYCMRGLLYILAINHNINYTKLCRTKSKKIFELYNRREAYSTRPTESTYFAGTTLLVAKSG